MGGWAKGSVFKFRGLNFQKNKAMSELYWIARLDSFCNVLLFASILSGIAIPVLIGGLYTDYEDDDTEVFKIVKKALKITVPVFILSICINVFTPTTKEAYMIYGVGGTIDYIKSDSVASKLPHKAIVAIDKYLEAISDNNHGNK